MSVPVLNSTQQREALRLLKLTLGVIDMSDPEHENYADSATDCLQALLEDVELPLRKLLDGVTHDDPVRDPDETPLLAQIANLNARQDVAEFEALSDGRFDVVDKLGTKFKGTYDQCVKFLDAGLEADAELARPTFEKPAKPNRLSYLGSGKIVTSHGTLDVDALIGVLLSTVAIYK